MRHLNVSDLAITCFKEQFRLFAYTDKAGIQGKKGGKGMKVLLLGSAGMLGSAIYAEGKHRGIGIVGVDLSDSQIVSDVSNVDELTRIIKQEKPDVIINTVAITSLDSCENNPALAYMVNARPVAIIASLCENFGIYLIHISTDHFFTGDGRLKHNEFEPVVLLNEYARTKYVAERFALIAQNSLIIRTSILGFKNIPEKLVFADWVFKSLQENIPIQLFNDYFTSSLTVKQLSKYLFNLLSLMPTGILNVGCKDVFSKKELILAINRKASFDRANLVTGSVLELYPRRAESLGLDISKVESILGLNMPSFDEVVDDLVKEYRRINSEV